jgi:hypothetical protein
MWDGLVCWLTSSLSTWFQPLCFLPKTLTDCAQQCGAGNWSSHGAAACSKCPEGKYLMNAAGETETASCTTVSFSLNCLSLFSQHTSRHLTPYLTGYMIEARRTFYNSRIHHRIPGSQQCVM